MDDTYWGKFQKKSKRCRPKFEYIDYDVERLGKKGSFSKHFDNYSTVTVICMLTDESEYVGGSNYFYVKGKLRGWIASGRRISTWRVF